MLDIHSNTEREIPFEDRRKLHDILEEVYRIAESELWKEAYARIRFEEFNALINKGEILIAYYNHKVAGGIHFYPINKNKCGFGMLCVDFKFKGLNIGKALIKKAEGRSSANGAGQMELAILRPKGLNIEPKERLKGWYERLGYVYTHSQDFSEIKPEKAQNLKCPCDFDYYVKVIQHS